MPYTGFKWYPDWSSEINVTYKMLSLVYGSYTYIEQRNIKIAIPKITMSFTLTELGSTIQDLIPSTQYIIPLFPFVHSGAKTGNKKITMSKNLTFFGNVVYLIDENGYFGTISSVTSTEVNLTNNWGGASTGYYYPAFLGDITSISKEIISRTHVRCNITCEEV